MFLPVRVCFRLLCSLRQTPVVADLKDVKKPLSWFLTKARSDKALKDAAERATRMPRILTNRDIEDIIPIDDSEIDLAAQEDEDHDEQEY